MAAASMLLATMLLVEGAACLLRGIEPWLPWVPTSPPLPQALGGDGGRLPSAAGQEQEAVQCLGQQVSPLWRPTQQR